MGARAPKRTGQGGKENAVSTPRQKGIFVKVPADLHRRLKADAALKGKELGELAEELFAIGIKYSTGLKLVNGGHGKD